MSLTDEDDTPIVPATSSPAQLTRKALIGEVLRRVHSAAELATDVFGKFDALTFIETLKRQIQELAR